MNNRWHAFVEENEAHALELTLDQRNLIYDADQHMRRLAERNAHAEDEIATLRTQLARAREEIDAYRAVISDATKRYSYIFDGWRKAQNNEEIADAVRKAMFDWEATRDRLYTEATP